MTLTPGSQFGHYEILSALGAGAMGEVYRATDTKLKRQVAIKVLPAALAEDPERLTRFAREAEVLASLNHPHVAAIYGVEDAVSGPGRSGPGRLGVRALVMELVEGPTLADRIRHGAIPLEEALSIAKQIAEALEAAHEQGIIHRDLKPANIKVRPDGMVKVLDFGLAKAIEPKGGSASGGMASTVSMRATQPGVIMGTAAYMSPEQSAGKLVDKRSDLWSFGVVLMEMLTGKAVFTGQTVSHVLAAVLRAEPEWTALPTNTPASIRTLLRRCLAKDCKQRLADAADARLEIEDALTSPIAEAPPAGVRRRVASLPILFAATAALVAAIVTWGWTRFAPSTPLPVTRTLITPPPSLPLTGRVAISPDGSFVVYVSRGQLVIRRLDRLEPSTLTGTTGAGAPFLYPDGQWVGYFNDVVQVSKVPVTGGAPIMVARLPASQRGATWLDDNTLIVATEAGGLLRISADSAEPTVLTTPDLASGEQGHWFPSVLPGSRAVLFTIMTTAGAQIAILDLQTGQHTVVVRSGRNARYVDSGHLVYTAGNGLSAVRFDLSRRAVVSDPVPVLDGVAIDADVGTANAAISATGTLVYEPGGVAHDAHRSLVWVDRQGHETAIAAPTRAYESARLSPDGEKVAMDSADQEHDIWVWDLVRLTLTRLTFDRAIERIPVWMQDSRHVIFMSTRTGQFNLYTHAADGTGLDVPLTSSGRLLLPNSTTPDGKFVIGHEIRPRTGRDLVRLAINAGDIEHRPVAESLVETPFSERNAEISPDGRFLTYQSDESGTDEIYVRPYPQVANGRWQVTTAGGTRPAWARGGRELLYLDGSKHLMAVQVETTASTFRAGPAAMVFATAYAVPNVHRSYDVTRDGERFLMLKDVAGSPETEPSSSLVVVQHWFEELKRLLPTK